MLDVQNEFPDAWHRFRQTMACIKRSRETLERADEALSRAAQTIAFLTAMAHFWSRSDWPRNSSDGPYRGAKSDPRGGGHAEE